MSGKQCLIAAAIILVLTGAYLWHESYVCSRKGGFLVRGLWSLQCVKGEIIQ